jgi:hypothetical protein
MFTFTDNFPEYFGIIPINRAVVSGYIGFIISDINQITYPL